VSLNITVHDQAEGGRIFEALADGGTIAMALEEIFFAPLFGVCVDRFGVSWMVNVEAAIDGGAEGAA
jgi:PhnB protein